MEKRLCRFRQKIESFILFVISSACLSFEIFIEETPSNVNIIFLLLLLICSIWGMLFFKYTYTSDYICLLFFPFGNLKVFYKSIAKVTSIGKLGSLWYLYTYSGRVFPLNAAFCKKIIRREVLAKIQEVNPNVVIDV